MQYLLGALFGFFIGAIPFSYIIPFSRGIDITKIGSGNIGATNATRAGGRIVGIISMILDISKGFIPAFLMMKFVSYDAGLITGLAAFLGHLYTPFLRFKGGKGVATAFGLLIAIDWRLAIVTFTIWAVIIYVTEYVSLASVTCFYFAAITALIFSNITAASLLMIMATISMIRHTENIEKLIEHKENKTNLIRIFIKGK
jgi:glycerol-3-phosphate acyltransferase PlsY